MSPQWARLCAAAAACVSLAAGPALAASGGAICSEDNIAAYFEQNPREATVDLARFYAAIKNSYSVYTTAGKHYAGTDAILNYWNENSELSDPRWLAYILATSYHETARRMAPVRETLASSDQSAIDILERAYQRRGSGKVYWRPVKETGRGYFGRGYVQLTWDWNYKRADLRLGEKAESFAPTSYYWNPDNALDPDASIRITYDGMVYGWYTSHCLLRHIYPGRKADWIDARRIINGLDRAAEIAEHANNFLIAIEAAAVPVPVVEADPVIDVEEPAGEEGSEDPAPPASVRQGGLFGSMLGPR
ncbi:MAG: hypothetical protein MI723_08625 [Caulobacterales bacterium]|nr:hypothetical protein [Caulobacterales bacterium]